MYTHFIPSFYGDVRIEEDAERPTTHSRLTYFKLNDAERAALKALSAHAADEGWTEKPLTIGEEESSVELGAPLALVKSFLVGALKPGRRVISVLFQDGLLEESVVAKTGEIRGAKTGKRAKPEGRGATVAAPTRGCPEPDFVKAELRARHVLDAFLTDEQREDFRRFNRILTVGASGRRYMVTSRHAKDELARYHRSLYDLDYDLPVCTHDYTVPAAEEMLTLHLLVQLPEWEEFIRGRPNEIDGTEPHEPWDGVRFPTVNDLEGLQRLDDGSFYDARTGRTFNIRRN